MSKNTDWGATAYLSDSIYGRGTSEVYINNCMKSINYNYNARTGWGADTASANSTSDCVVGTNDTGAYHTTQGQHASTTDNIYGIYDMSGGNWEYVMGGYDQTISGSGFSTLPDAKYYNNYPSSIFIGSGGGAPNNNYCTWATCGGHALHETKAVQSVFDSSVPASWGGDGAIFVNANSPWFFRGGGASTGAPAGLWYSNIAYGQASNVYGWRAVAGAP
jgi:hypothetical protein